MRTMTFFSTIAVALLVLSPVSAIAADDDLKSIALEALIHAPEERSLPIVKKVLAGKESDTLKRRALFLLSQMDSAEATEILLATARSGSPPLREESIRMIAVGGKPAALAELGSLYADGDPSIRQSVLNAYLIADDSDAILRIANTASNDEEFDNAVRLLGAMGATEQLRTLRNSSGASQGLIQAYAIAGDFESLSELARDSSRPDLQLHALQGLGITGDARTGAVLGEIYRTATTSRLKQGALQGLLVAQDTDTMLTLFRESSDAEDKKSLLRMLVIMDSDAVFDIVDATLGGEE